MVQQSMIVKVIFVLIFYIATFNNTPRNNNKFCVEGQRYFEQRLPPQQHKKFNNLRPFLPPKTFKNVYTGRNVLHPPRKQLPNLSKRFLSSETKQSMRDISVASNSIIHDNYISQQFKWSNR